MLHIGGIPFIHNVVLEMQQKANLSKPNNSHMFLGVFLNPRLQENTIKNP